jgi:(p)ppGpp synthase/HD superfamily hydrolase
MGAYSERLDAAFALAHEVHRTQTRKGTGVPYITHVSAVAALVGGYGGTEEQVIGAMLHDAIEDGVEEFPDIADRIGEAFGEEVLAIVLACSDTVVHPKPPWKERKDAYIAHVKAEKGSDPALLVTVADKLHNARSMVRDLNLIGLELFERFRATRDQTLWYYRTLADTLVGKDWPTPLQAEMAAELERTVATIEALTARLAAE